MKIVLINSSRRADLHSRPQAFVKIMAASKDLELAISWKHLEKDPH